MLADWPTNEIHEGRWLSPDPLGGDITNPQSLNRYAYALNNPTTRTDPTGLAVCNAAVDNRCHVPPKIRKGVKAQKQKPAAPPARRRLSHLAVPARSRASEKESD